MGRSAQRNGGKPGESRDGEGNHEAVPSDGGETPGCARSPALVVPRHNSHGAAHRNGIYKGYTKDLRRDVQTGWPGRIYKSIE